MLIKHRLSSDVHENDATPEHVFFNRRKFMGAAAGTAAFAAATPAKAQLFDFLKDEPLEPAAPDPSEHLYPAQRNEAFTLDRDITNEETATTYNNFYEFGSSKRIARKAQALETRPWEITIDGMVDKPMTIGIDDLLKMVDLEERLYRHRCVEAWAMAVPWTGFPIKKLLNMVGVKSEAKFVEMRTFMNPKVARGQKQRWYPWPYTEVLAKEEAANDLAFLVTGVYGAPLPKQMGAPLRLAVPWKYGFKSIKSINHITLTDKRSKTFWESFQESEYGFFANVNPEVPHARWSQATESLIGTAKRVKTQKFNGYGEQVAHLYSQLPQGDYLYR